MAPNTRIVKRGAQEPEDAAELKLGDEFNDAGCLLVSEVQVLLNQRDQSLESGNSMVYTKTLAHVSQFSRPLEEVTTIRSILMREGDLFKPFEIAQIGNLLPKGAEEAKSLIPSLSKVDDDKLQGLLDELMVMKRGSDDL
ncbi:RNA polymerase II, fourth largest subunit [Phaffia rhodozyma]|uniref:RNA polymerase II, fourth largest subunit n=1 Tax=Phaffia rhodozyma TaxID=264483 RepID=A0A0F7SU07_PHARH|nr:RNA polymerase II, fourth largest subunit [Phaffia rhodozyma]